jgi:hypothetical protein
LSIDLTLKIPVVRIAGIIKIDRLLTGTIVQVSLLGEASTINASIIGWYLLEVLVGNQPLIKF